MIKKGSFAQIYQKSNSKTEEFDGFTQSMYSQTEQFSDNNMQEYLVIWGDSQKNTDNETAKNCLIQQFSFLKDRIFQYQDSKIFRFVSINLYQKNILFLMSGKFAQDKYDGISNLEWLNDKISRQEIHSKSIIIFTSLQFIVQNNLSIESLQMQFKYVTQLAVQYKQLTNSFDKMIHNRIHMSFVQNKNLDFYFGSKVNQVLKLFQCHDNLKLPLINFEKEFEKWNEIWQYSKQIEIQSPFALHLNENDIRSIYSIFKECSKRNQQELSKYEVIQNILNLYTQESVLYKFINLSMNTMNLIIYKYLMMIYQLFSRSLYEYQDQEQISEVKLYRGCAIQKYQYDTLYQEYLHNQNNGIQTFICFPQFLSTTIDKKKAQELMNNKINQVKQQQDLRSKMAQVPQETAKFLKSIRFNDQYRLLIQINAKMDYQNKFKPKYINKISSFKDEHEFLFQPFQSFRIDNMQKGNGINESIMNMTLFYVC
ncbi:hypothetical protein ABPG72_007531 [Tetrahymena utriculariae]